MKNRDIQSMVAFVSMTYGVSWTIWLTGILAIPGLTSIGDERFWWFLFAGSFAPTIAALVTTGLFSGRLSIGSLLKRLILVKVNWKIYGITFFLLPVIGITTYLGLGIAYKIDLWKIAITAIALGPVNALLGGVIFGVGPLGEEMGWRGFLQDRLQGHLNSVVTAIIVGLIWAIWHFPAAIFFEDFRNGISLAQFIMLYPISTILASFIMAHLWRWSKGSLFIAIFFHAVMNTTANYLVSTGWWDFGDLTPLQSYLIILVIFALMASATELLSRTVLRPSTSASSP
jgi:membrane protease YdiL (CAAX protease family)